VGSAGVVDPDDFLFWVHEIPNAPAAGHLDLPAVEMPVADPDI
jgi:hypothetical protein